jgi:hypothetical protein
LTRNILYITTNVASLIPPFETIGFLEAKWLEVLRELVEYGNKNILRNFALYLVTEERRGEEYAKEATSGILDIKKLEDKGKEKEQLEEQEAVNQPQHHHNGSNNNNNQSWYTRPRDKNGRFMSSGAVTAATTAASNTTTAVAITTTPIIATAKPPSSPSWHNNKLRDSRGRFTTNRTAWLKPY